MEDGLQRLHRELGFTPPRAVQARLHFNEAAAKRLSLEAVLRGHSGCVNRLCWNESGSLLASGSDDRKVMLWSYPDTQRQPLSLETEHQANVFGVRFLPQTGDTRLVTGAMDYTVQLHQLDAPPASMHPPVRAASSTRRNPNLATTAASVRSVVYSCHRSRVKDVAVEPLNPHLFWSAAEDGCVRQFDTRVPTAQQRDYDSSNMLLCVRSKGRFAELKSLNVNPANPQQLAVAASDPLLRIYDRRMLTTGAPVRLAPPAQPMLALAPPHLAMATAAAGSGNGGRASRMHATYVAWGNRGDKVVATYHGDHAYCFDVTGAGQPASSSASSPQQPGGQPLNLFAQPAASAALAAGAISHGLTIDGQLRNGGSPVAGASSSANGYSGSSNGSMADLPGMLPAAAERAKADGNLALFSKQLYEAVHHYSTAIRLAPWAPSLYTNRALALLQRGWGGDAMCALRDAETAVCLDPSNPKAHYRRLQALRAAGMLQSATTAIRLFKRHFPESASDVEGFGEVIAAETARQQQQAELRRQQAEQRRQQRRRRGLQFDRARRERRQQQQQAAVVAGDEAELGAAGAAAGPPAGQAQQAAQQAAVGGTSPGSPATAASPVVAEPAGPSGSSGSGNGAAGEASGAAAPAAPAGPPPAADEGWDDLYASASSDEDEAEDSAAAAAGAASGSGIDAQYAAALEAAAAGGATAEEAAAAPGAPSLDVVVAAQQAEAAGAKAPPRQPSLWNAFEGGRRMLQRYIGQCNLQTDIKEACFLGCNDELVAAGSDDGRVFIFRTATGECIRVFTADEDVANAVQPHPHLPVLATSGIESTVKLWSPEGEPTAGGNIGEVVRRNQERLKEGPTVLRGIDPRIIAALSDNPELLRALVQRAVQRPGSGGEGSEHGEEGQDEGGSDEDEDDEERGVREVSCRVA